MKSLEQSKLARAKGATRNLTAQFLKAKLGPGDDDARSRFQPLKSSLFSGVSSPQESVTETVKLVMPTKASDGDSDDYGKRFLPPLWVDLQEEIEQHIADVTAKSKSLATDT